MLGPRSSPVPPGKLTAAPNTIIVGMKTIDDRILLERRGIKSAGEGTEEPVAGQGVI